MYTWKLYDIDILCAETKFTNAKVQRKGKE